MALELYVPPKIEVVAKRRHIFYFGNVVAATVQLTLVTPMIDFPFEIVEVMMEFPNDSANLLRYYWLYGRSPDRNVAAIPTGENIFKLGESLPYHVGHSLTRILPVSLEVTDIPCYIKLHSDNTLLAYAQNIVGYVIIEEL